ncbi:hypothetical protein ACIPJK_16215 [Streptomyces roseus]|uniref:hypothetical protein n=1 Tax=Streptomyces roseus TaxID=66430 RepID=UPI0038113459
MLLACTGLRASNVALLAAPSPEDRRRTGRRGEQGGETTEVTIRKVIGHDIAHINQIYRAIRPVREAFAVRPLYAERTAAPQGRGLPRGHGPARIGFPASLTALTCGYVGARGGGEVNWREPSPR